MAVTAFQRIRIACNDIAQAVESYQALFGFAPIWQGKRQQSGQTIAFTAWFQLENTIIELIEMSQGDPAVVGLVMSSVELDATTSVEYHTDDQLVSLDEQQLPANTVCDQWVSLHGEALPPAMGLVQPPSITSDCVSRVDHIVLYTGDADACIRAFGEEGLGIRLALDKNVPEWGGRMLFFRAGQLTLEVIEPNKGIEGDDYFWGIAFQVPDLDARLSQLKKQGVLTSDARDGRKPGTRVATVKSHHLNIPTLLVQPAMAV
ncbi:MAG: hypothetical protein CL693_02460 [Cellvibrionaceae bacterium]|nr:hypothetical protein [Cellvibrionaceae bacterium]|tara:strand:- start:30945 stop:31727 length:783 start_codon:yes stop_codon:yes gene_type:complete